MKSPNYPSNYDNNKHVTFPLEVYDIDDDDDENDDDDDDDDDDDNIKIRHHTKFQLNISKRLEVIPS